MFVALLIISVIAIIVSTVFYSTYEERQFKENTDRRREECSRDKKLIVEAQGSLDASQVWQNAQQNTPSILSLDPAGTHG